MGTCVVPTFQKRTWMLTATEEAAKGTYSVVGLGLLGSHFNHWSHSWKQFLVQAFENAETWSKLQFSIWNPSCVISCNSTGLAMQLILNKYLQSNSV